MQYIQTTEELNKVCGEIKKNTKLIGIDTEFIRRNHYFPKLCLIQMCFYKKQNLETYLIDTISPDLKLEPFVEILQSKKIKKVFYCPIQDVEAFYKATRKIPNGIEDVQLMAEFCGYKHHTGYGNLVEQVFGVHLSKSKSIQVSDWKKRPLSDRQIEYASNDVKYLLEMFNLFTKKLKANKNFKFYQDEIKGRFTKNFLSDITENCWKRMRFKLHGKSFEYVFILQNLCKWREERAIKKNSLKSYIIGDATIKKLSRVMPTDLDMLKFRFNKYIKIARLSVANKSKIVQCIKDGQQKYQKYRKKVREEVAFAYEPRGVADKEIYKQIRALILDTCQQRAIAPELVFNKGNIVSVISGNEKLKNILRGWKYKVVGKKIKKILSKR